ncbi:hypothetical protein RAS1_35070 [Phycisphaerae bacterium RAS1]|nr:hypothetical protein RAS1_35070 [Phycisphaerae bacterium RAS1]
MWTSLRKRLQKRVFAFTMLGAGLLGLSDADCQFIAENFQTGYALGQAYAGAVGY